MKNYDGKFIYEFIEKNKKNISSVELGMKEDWDWTCESVFESDEGYCIDMKDKLYIAGICGSTWGTPCMRVVYKDGTHDIIDCYTNDGNVHIKSRIKEQMMFAKLTGGMDEVPD